MDATDSRKKVISGVIAGSLAAALTVGGMYAVAATAATEMAAYFTPPEAQRHARITDIANALNRATLEQRVADAKCRRLKSARRKTCDGEAAAAERRAVEIARGL